MKKHAKPLLIGGLAVLGIAIWLALPGWSTMQMEKMMGSYGFHIVSIEKVRIGFDGAEFTGIALDKDSFSTIGSLRIPVTLFQPYAAVIKDFALTGELGNDGTLSIDGWDMRRPRFPNHLKTLILDSARLDVMTPAGAIRIEAKGQMTANKTGRHIDAVLYGDQNQLTFDTRWTTDWNSDESWKTKVEVGNLRLRTDSFEMARSSGDMTIESGAVQPVIKGRLAAGLLTLGTLSLRENTMTLNGAPDALHLLLQGHSTRWPSITVTAGIKRHGKDPSDLGLAVKGQTLNDLTLFTGSAGAGSTAAWPGSVLLKNIDLSPVDLETIRKGARNFKSDALTLTLAGKAPPFERTVTLAGKTGKKIIKLKPR